MLPDGADAVVPVEDTDAPRGVAELPRAWPCAGPPRPGEHVRRPAATSGPASRSPRRARSCGRRRWPCWPRAAMGRCAFTAGRGSPSLAPATSWCAPASRSGPARSTTATGRCWRRSPPPDGADATRAASVADDLASDDPDADRRRSPTSDLVLTSGGVSVGAHDVVRLAFESVGRMRALARRRPARQAAGVRAAQRAGGAGRCCCSACPATRSAASSRSSCSCGRSCAGWRATPIRSGRERRPRPPRRGASSKHAERRAFLRVTLAAGPTAGRAGWRRWPVARVARAVGAGAADGLAIVPEEVATLPPGP